jgi:hypothetical protein
MGALGAVLHFILPRRLGGGVALGSALVVLASSIAVASIPDSAGVIHGCYQQKTGLLRVVDSGADSCRPDETAIQWSQTGPQGPVGPQGSAGPAGPPGSTGLPVYADFIGSCGSGTNGPPAQRNAFGIVVGTFSSPVSSTGCVGSTFRMHQTFDIQNLNGPGGPFAMGTGSATCDPCTVAGRTGSLTLSLTTVGSIRTDDAGNLAGEMLGGTWTISSATGDLAGLTGQGTYGPVAFLSGQTTYPGPIYVPNIGSAEVFTGIYSLPA